MAIVGRVSFLQGYVVAEDAAGNQRVLTIGDDVLDLEQIITSVGSSIEINMVTGDNVVIENGQSWSPTADTFTNVQDFATADATLSPEDLALQEALLAGADPTQFGQATAVGTSPGADTPGAEDDGTNIVVIDRLAEEHDPEAGYETTATEASIEAPILDSQIIKVAESEITLTLQIVATDAEGLRLTLSEVEEGAAAYYKVITVDQTGAEVTPPASGSVDVEFNDITAIGQTDYVANSLTVVIGEVFQTQALDDLFNDSGEQFNVKLVPNSATGLIVEQVDNLQIDDQAVITTINDEALPENEDTVFVQISVDKSSVEEGGKLNYTVSLVDENGQPVSVPTGNSITVDLTWSGAAANKNDADPLPTTVTINSGSETSFVVSAIDDVFSEDPEALVATVTQVTDIDDAFEILAIGDEDQASAIIIDEPEDTDVVFAQISVDKRSVEEGGELTYTVKLVDENGDAVEVPNGESVTVKLAWTGPAANAADADPLPSSVTISGNSEISFVVDAIDDVYKEELEALIATISSVEDTDAVFEAFSVGAENAATSNIFDEIEEPDAVFAQISVDRSSVEEGGQLTYTVTLVDQNGVEVSVLAGDSVSVSLDWTGPAANLGDVSELPPSVTITGDSKASFVIQAVDDVYKEDPEALVATISAVDDIDDAFEQLSVGIENQATTTITDEQETEGVYAQISVDQASVAEGGTLTYTVKIVDGNGDAVVVPVGDTVTLTLDWSGAAANVSDASVLLEHVSITGGSETSFVVDAIDDLYKEDREPLVATISAVDDVNDTFELLFIGSQKEASTTITDEANPTAEDTVFAQISVDKNTVEEGGKLTYTVKLVDKDGNPVEVPAGESVTVDLSWSDAAANDADASPLPATITITGGSEQSFVVDAIDDLYKEAAETLTVTIDAINDVDGNFEIVEVGADNSVDAIITDEAIPTSEDTVFAQISVDKDTVAEGGKLTYTVKLVDKDGSPVAVPAGESVTVDLSWSDAAANDSDASPLPATITITGGSEQSFVVDAIDDLYKEAAETLTVTIDAINDVDGNFEKVEVGADNSVDAIITDEANPTSEDTVFAKISVDKNAVEEGGKLTYTVKLVDKDGNPVEVPVGESVTIDLSWSDAAANDSDASPLPATITISGGSEQSFVVDAIDDLYKEDAETLTVTIDAINDVDGNFEKVEVGADNSVDAIITDEANPTSEDTVFAQISVDKNAVEEGGKLTYTVKLVDKDGNPVEVPVGESVTIDLSWSDAAANDSDASPLPATITISGGSEQSFVVDAIDDLYKEAAETLTVTIDAINDVDGNFEKVEGGADNSVDAIITDEANPTAEDTVFAQISVDKDTVAEGGKLTYTVQLVDKDGNAVEVPAGESVTVDLSWSDAAANANDASPLPATVTITAGSVETFEVNAVDDLFKEDPETLTVTITDVTDVDGNFEKVEVGTSNSVDAIITDEAIPTSEDTVFAVIQSTGSVNEGGESEFVVSLVDENGNPVEVSQTVEIQVSFANVSAEVGDFDASPITLTISSGSSVSFLVQTNTDADTQDETFIANIDGVDDNGQFEKVDWTTGVLVGTGNEQSPSALATIIDVNDSPIALTGDATTISEEGLANANPDDTGVSDTTNAVSSTGALSFIDQHNNGTSSFSINITEPSQTLSSQGEPVTDWRSSNGGMTLTGFTASGTAVVKVEVGDVAVDPATINGFTAGYQVTLLAPVDHPDTTTEDIISLDFGFTVNESQGDSASGSFQVTIEDDAPIAADSTQSIEVIATNTNLMVVLDLSGSMNQNANGDGDTDKESRLDLAKDAINKLIEQYDDLGDIKVRIVTFDTNADAYMDVWVSAADAISYIDSLSAGGATNFDGALAVAMDAFDDAGAISGAQNLSYFFSDGQPNRADGDDSVLSNATGIKGSDAGIQPDEEQIWIDFLNAQEINSFAIGLGDGSSTDTLDPIAFDGIEKQNGAAIIVDDLDDLDDVLVQTIEMPVVTGNLLGVLTVGFGADTGFVQNVSVQVDINGTDTLVTFSYDPDADEISNDAGLAVFAGSALDVASSIALVQVDMSSGEYEYRSTGTAAVGSSDNIAYTLVDLDGDNAAGTVSFNYEAPTSPVAVDDYGITNAFGLTSEYYAYHQGSIDGSNLSSVDQVNSFIAANNPDATFIASNIAYGDVTIKGNLGGDNDTGDSKTNLETFLGSDAASLSVDNPQQAGDAILKMFGLIDLSAGTYQFKVLADDGYSIMIDGVVVAQVDNNQAPKTTTHAEFTIATDGLHSIEIIYWDQGGRYVFKPELSSDGVNFNALSDANFATYQSFEAQSGEALNIAMSDILANDSDPQNDTLTITNVFDAQNGTVAMVNDQLVFTPDAGYQGAASFNYTITDGNGGFDDATVYLNVTPELIHGVTSTADTNVLIMLDTSGSMGGDNLSKAKDALENMLDKYAESGNVKVQLATFSDTENGSTSGWISVSAALAVLDQVTTGGGTNYDYALQIMQSAFVESGKLVNANNVSYFLSDGVPTLSSTVSGSPNDGSITEEILGDGIDQTEAEQWIEFLSTTGNEITSYAVAIGNNVDAKYLDPIAYDGTTEQPLDAIIPAQLSELSQALVDSVAVVGQTFIGNANANIMMAGLGEDFLTGNAGADTFVFDAEHLNSNTVETDTITDFSQSEGDQLDLSDLLSGATGSNLDNYLNFESLNGDTLMHVNKDGDFATGGDVDQTILLKSIDLVQGGLTDDQIINDLLANNNLIID